MQSLSVPPAPGTLGARIRHRRRQLGITLGEAATMAGMSKPYLSLIENDKCRPPSDGKLISIATALSLHADVLLTLKYVKLVRRMPPAQRDAVHAALEQEAGVEVCHA